MTLETWVVATDGGRLAAMVSLLRGLGGRVTVIALGPRSAAEAAAAARPDAVRWVDVPDDVPVEAYTSGLLEMSDTKPHVVLATARPADRVLLGAVAAALDAVVVPGVVEMTLDGDTVVATRSDLGGRVLETLASGAPVAALFGGADAPAPPDGSPAPPPIERWEVGAPADIRVEKTEAAAGAGAGIGSAERVVAVGRGLKAKADLALLDGLADALGAAVGCSMPVADDFGWMAKDHYVGRSGQHISPRLYVAVGISGAPQHLDGVRDAKVVVAINSDPDARIFAAADYGIVGDLYEVLPELRAAVTE